MKSLFILALTAGTLFACSSKNEEEQLPLDSTKKKLSYLMGAENARQLLQDPNLPKYKKDEMIKGFEESLGKDGVFDENCRQTLQSLFGQTPGEFHEEHATTGSLCIGKFLGSQFRSSWQQAKFFNEFDQKYLVYGFKSGLNATDTLVKEDEKKTILETFMSKVNTKVMAEVTQRETKFFNQVKAKAGIQAISNGIYVETILAGKGGNPAAGDDVKSHYVLMNIEGDTLQSSLGGPQVPVFNLGQVIPGWTIAFPTLKKGGKYKLYVPQNMAYGKDTPDPNTIPPFSTLVFYVELIDFGPAGTLK